MASFPVVDSHVHVLPPDPAGAEPARDPYEIWEYGDKAGVDVLDVAGTLEEVTAAMRAARCDHFVVVNMFVASNELRRMAGGAGPAPTLDTHGEQLRERLREFNRWAVGTAAQRPDMTAFVAADPGVLGGQAGAEHLSQCLDAGARGIKVHPIAQAFMPDDPRMTEVYRTCESRHAAVVAHAGASRGGAQWAEPRAFAPVLADHPGLTVVLAHLGGAHWRQAVELAASFPTLSFDLCEIIAWTGAPGAPDHAALGRMIKEIGPERVLFGTDFPWYDVEATIDQVMELPYLADEEKEAILGANAVRVLGLDVAL